MSHTSGRNAEVQKTRRAQSSKDSFTSLLRLTHSHGLVSGTRSPGVNSVNAFFFCHSGLIYLVIRTTMQPQRQPGLITSDKGL